MAYKSVISAIDTTFKMRSFFLLTLLTAFLLSSSHGLIAQCIPTNPTITGVSSSCNNAKQVFTTEAGNSNYVWNVTGGLILTGAGTNQVTVLLNSQQTLTASVSVSYAVGGCLSTVTNKTINLTLSPVAQITGSFPANGIFCESTTIPLSVPSGMSNYKWEFYTQVPGQTTTTTVVTGNVTSSTVSIRVNSNWASSNFENVNVMCWFTDPANPSCSTFSNKVLSVFRVPTITLPSSTCVGTSVQVTGAGYAGYPSPNTFVWKSTDHSDITNIESSFTNSTNIAWASAGSKIVELSVNGCSAPPQTIVVNPRPVQPTITASTDPICVHVPVTYSVTGLSTCQWFVGPTGVLPGQIQFADAEVISGNTSPTLNLKWLNGGSKDIYVKGADTNGCEYTGAVAMRTVSVNGPSITGPSVYCVGGSPPTYAVQATLSSISWSSSAGTLSSAGASASVNWNGVTGGQSVSVTSSGTIGGCTISVAQPLKKSIIIGQPPSAPLITGATIACIESFGSYSGPPATPAAPIGYQWTVQPPDIITGPTNAAFVQVQWKATGNRSITLSTFDQITGCFSTPVTQTVSISTPPAIPTVSLVPSPNAEDTGPGNPIRICNAYSATLTTPTLTGATYQWYRNGIPYQSSSNTLSVSSTSGSGTYSVSISKGGCTVTSLGKQVTFFSSTPTQLMSPQATFVDGAQLCPGGSAQLSLSQYLPNLQWLKDGAAIPNQPVGTNPYTINYPTTGIYSVQGTYLGCSIQSNSFTVISQPTPITIAASTTCLGGGVNSIVLTASGPAGVFNWTKDGTPFASAQTSVTVSAKGTYVASQTIGSCTATGQIIIADVPNVSLNTSTSVTACGSYVLGLVNPASGQTYQWYKDGSSVLGQVANQINITTTGSYRVSVSNTVTGCAAYSQSIAVTINALPTVALNTSTSVTQCGPYTLQVLNPVVGNNYQWTKDGVAIGANVSTLPITSPSVGSYKVRVTAPTGCYVESNQVSVTVNAIPNVSLNTSNAIVQCGGAYILSVVSPPTGVNYEWRRNNVVVGTNSPSLNITTSGTGSYKVMVTNVSTGCTFTTPTVDITINPVPTGTITASGPTTFCHGGAVTLQVADGTIWQWRLNGSNIVGATTSSLVVNASGSYSAVVSNSSNCSVTSNLIAVTVNPLPNATVAASGPTTICAGGSVALNVTGGSTYQWLLNGGIITGATGSAYLASSSGSYSAIPISNAGCSGGTSNGINVIVNQYPVSTITAGGPTTFCAGGSVALSAPAGNDTYAWYLNTGYIGSSTQIVATSSGSYSVIVTKSGCSTTSPAVDITVNPVPTVSVTPSSVSICSGQTSTLTAGPSGMTYWWLKDGVSVGSTSQSIQVNSGGTYSVQVTSENGCTNNTSSYVTILTLPAPPGIYASTPSCGSVTLSSATGASGYSWSNGLTSSSITVVSTGTYSLQIMGANGCWGPTSSFNVTSIPSTNYSAINRAGQFCPDGFVQLIPSYSNGTPTSFSWTGGFTTPTLNVYGPGTYSCTITFLGGCSITRSINVPRQSGCNISIVAAPELEPQQIDELIVSTTLFPNPASTEVMVVTPPMNVVRKVTLFSMQGIAVQNDVLPSGASRHTMKLPLVAEGMYLLKLDGVSGVEVHKVMIRRE